MKCPHCNQEHPNDLHFCPMTGKEISRSTTCTRCGKEVNPKWEHCVYCGENLARVDEKVEQVVVTLPIDNTAPLNKQQLPHSTSTPRKLIWLGVAAAIILVLVGVFARSDRPQINSTQTHVTQRPNWGSERSTLQKSNGPEGGSIHALVGDPFTPSIPTLALAGVSLKAPTAVKTGSCPIMG